jgi:hypothetical protein
MTSLFCDGEVFPLDRDLLMGGYQYPHPKTFYTDCIYRKIHKKSIGQTPEKRFALLKNDITNNLRPQKPVIYSRNHKFWVEDFETKS